MGFWLTAIFVVVVASHLLLFASPPLARTEVHRALVAMDVLDHGHWVVTSILGETYLRKPPFHPWVLAGSSWLFNTRDAWVFRLPSILAAGGCAVWLAWLGSRWFGRRAGILTGFSFLWLFALWAQNRTAEIDGLNTLLALLAWGAWVELAMGRTSYRWWWSAVAGLSFGGALLTKGPACLTLVLPAFVAPVLAGLGVRWWVRPSVWVPVLAGLGIGASWYVAVDVLTSGGDEVVEQAGVSELVERFTSGLSMGLAGQVLVMPLLLVVYSVPVSLGAMALAWPSVRRSLPKAVRRRAMLCVWSFVVGGVLSVLFLLENVRYGYILVPLLTLPAGVVLDRLFDRRLPEWVMVHLDRLMVACGVGAFVALGVVMALMVSWGTVVSVWVMIVVLLAVLFRARPPLGSHSWLRMGTLVLVVVSMIFSVMKHEDRSRYSSAEGAVLISEHVDAGRDVVAGKLWNDKPGLFYYGRVTPRRLLDEALAGEAPAVSRWYVLYPFEVEALTAVYGDRVEVVEVIEGERLNARLVRLGAGESE